MNTKIKYKTKLFAAVIILLFYPGICAAQTNDSIINTPGKGSIFTLKNATLYYEKPNITVNEITMPSKVNFGYLTNLRFLNNGKLLLANSIGETDTTEFKYVQGLKIRSGSYTGSGILAGAAIGTIIGVLIGVIIDNSDDDPKVINPYSSFNLNLDFNFGVPIGAVVGLLSGSLFGGIIGSQIDDVDYINLAKFNEKNRKDELIKFLNNR